MFDVTTFLLRWLFLSNLARDVAEIQTLPYQAYYPSPQHLQAQQHQHSHLPKPIQKLLAEEAWRDHCVRGILSYPPGTQRLLAMDAVRVELVQGLSRKLSLSDETLELYNLARRHGSHHHFGARGRRQQGVSVENDSGGDDSEPSPAKSDQDDPFLDADVEILRAFEEAASRDGEETAPDNERQNRETRDKLPEDSRQAMLVISKTGTNVLDSSATDDTSSSLLSLSASSAKEPSLMSKPNTMPTVEELQEASSSSRLVRDYLPQLVSAVLKSPPAFEPHLANPIHNLRHLILQRCRKDPSWGIELCWLLEAEVGRAWKTLFEHRQQTGRRLIIVLPAEKASVLAKIGTEKREAFDLLQDAEQATAFGYNMEPVHEVGEYAATSAAAHEAGSDRNLARLPSSLSLRRCSHFGDTMHFIDRLTQISLDLRMIPVLQRHGHLREQLYGLNRRLRRRMATRGDVSIDVEDNRGVSDWPQINDMATEMVKFSVHFPLVPQKGDWPSGGNVPLPNGEGQTPATIQVARALNIVVPECRILASRERCPFLIHLELADTGLEGSDARLYASGVNGLGSTVEEALNMGNGKPVSGSLNREKVPSSYEIPPELLDRPQLRVRDNDDLNVRSFPRGGSGIFYDSYEDVRQHEYEQLHEQMQASPQPLQAPPPPPHPTVKLGPDLLDRVFGRPWDEKCEEIRQASPYGMVEGWRLASFIMKAGEDIRREALVMQIISKLQTWFQEEIPEAHRPFMRPYTILAVGGNAGLVECLSDAKSVDEVKKQTDGFESLRSYFERSYGPPGRNRQVSGYGPPSPPILQTDQISFEQAQDNFLRSLVGYSLLCYVLQIKDRHNGNILLDRFGHIMHIDFGFVLGDTPKMGKVPIFNERAPFKLSTEFWEVLGGWNLRQGGLGVRFCKMFELAFACASSHTDEIASLVEATVLLLDSNVGAARDAANSVRSRLRMRGPSGSVEQKTFVMDIVNAALTSWGTSTYDWLQKNMNGYQ
jgi:phosphatidylinositol 4-kinase